MLRKANFFISKIIDLPQRLVDPIGMYRVVTLGLIALVVGSYVASFFGEIAYEVSDLTVSLAVALVIGLGFNVLCGLLWKVPANHESGLITALIVFLLMIPNDDLAQNWQLAGAVALGVISKYMIAYRKQHILNPAATGMVLVALGVGGVNLLTGSEYSSDIFQWWVANPSLFWVLVITGSLVTFKIRRWPMVLACIGVGGAIFMAEWWVLFERVPYESGEIFLTSFPVLFLAFFMLTEPFTTPPTKRKQIIYGAMVGALSSTIMFAQVGFPMTPELALVIGNIVMYPLTLRQKLVIALKEKREIAANTLEFVFEKPANMVFRSGQYLEWMLPHKPTDNRGLRRYFTIASAPEEKDLRLAVRTVPEKASAYKKALEEMKPGDTIIASQRAGDFMLQDKEGVKYAFVAGGIGVTPFSSHLSHMNITGKWNDSVLYYCNNESSEIAYKDTFEEYAKNNAFTLVHVLAKEEVAGCEHGYLTNEIIERQTPDYLERVWYLSGPPGMVNAYYNLLRTLGVPKSQIEQDFFPGLA